MDEQEEVKRNIQSSRDDGGSGTDPIPPDLTFEILSRLPAKSIVRYRSVSKLWSSITTTPEFIRSFASLCSSVLLIFQKDDTLIVFSSPIHHQNLDDPKKKKKKKKKKNRDDPISYVRSLKLTNQEHGPLGRFDSVHGLICLEASTQLEIWNPTMQRFLTLRVPQGKYIRGFLGYDPIHGKYKALCILTGQKIGILTLGGAQESWRIISNGFPKHTPATAFGRCINGVVYYKAFFGLLLKHAIMSFDVRSEKFNLIHYPRDYGIEFYHCLLVSYKGRLALVGCSYSPIKIWILEDAENHKWSYTHFPPYKNLQGLHFSFEGVIDAGEFIYIHRPLSSNDWLYVVYYDPTKNSTREFKSGGTRCGSGLELCVLPNHIESLMPLQELSSFFL